MRLVLWFLFVCTLLICAACACCLSCHRVQQAAQQAPGIRHLASLATDAAAGRTGASVITPQVTGASFGSTSMSLFAAVASRLLTCLNQTSHAAICRCAHLLLEAATAFVSAMC